MPKQIVYIFIFLIASNSSFIQQFYKLPVLIQHYEEHKQLMDLSFMDFLSMHYWGEDLKDNDADRDMQLPFKTINSSSVHFVFILDDKDLLPTPFNPELPQLKIPTYRSDLFSDPNLLSLFRPPIA
ncbi:hypothetical protein HNP37_004730 [Flavobacterium nitrogenifigens]|uniref:Uncharacterized protein n=2 Tax=Flavobacterium TaxID=237 RepID=A0A7W7N985_9FLAO|nr:MULTISPECIES: hypothetical protein [Flavobacterium]MBB4804633.1 hypothetical protein [Flavobacterium nitrogenifigens]MBB6389592.1 hypothetical protein [Flavobacterium notoginsengisoli]